jgi:hypothetical protein
MAKFDESIEEIHNAALNAEPLNRFSSLVLKKALDLTGVTEGRLRFVDFNKEDDKKRLVPGAITGELFNKNPEKFVRYISTGGLIARAFTEKKTVYSDHVQTEDGFIRFKDWAKVQYGNDPFWQNYFKILDKINYQIAAPVKERNKVIGVLSVHSSNSIDK